MLFRLSILRAGQLSASSVWNGTLYVVHLEYHVLEWDENSLSSLFSSSCTQLRFNTLGPGKYYIDRPHLAGERHGDCMLRNSKLVKNLGSLTQLRLAQPFSHNDLPFFHAASSEAHTWPESHWAIEHVNCEERQPVVRAVPHG